MQLTFKKSSLGPNVTNGPVVTKLRGVGPKTSKVLASEGIYTIKQFKVRFDNGGVPWLRKILPKGVRWRVVAHSVSSCMV